MTYIHNLDTGQDAQIGKDDIDFLWNHPLKEALDHIDFQAASFDDYGTGVFYENEELEINGYPYTLSPSAKKWLDHYEKEIETKPIGQIEIPTVHFIIISPDENEDPNTPQHGWLGTIEDQFQQGE